MSQFAYVRPPLRAGHFLKKLKAVEILLKKVRNIDIWEARGDYQSNGSLDNGKLLTVAPRSRCGDCLGRSAASAVKN